jgi:hypothetical protein
MSNLLGSTFSTFASAASSSVSVFAAEEKVEEEEEEEEVVVKDPIIDFPGKNSDTYLVVSAVEIQNLICDNINPNHLTGYGEVSTFVVVKYGQFEKRTATFKESLHPEWNASYVFEYNKNVNDVLFMFFSQDVETGETQLFGHIVIPLKDENHPVPMNTPFIRELCAIVPCEPDLVAELRQNHLANNCVPTWPSAGVPTMGEVCCCCCCCCDLMKEGRGLCSCNIAVEFLLRPLSFCF